MTPRRAGQRMSDRVVLSMGEYPVEHERCPSAKRITRCGRRIRGYRPFAKGVILCRLCAARRPKEAA